MVILRGDNPQDRMSALGQKQTFGKVGLMSALPPIADIGTQSWNVRFVPKADIGPGEEPDQGWSAAGHVVLVIAPAASPY
jgi:hypothetical protein